MSIDSEVDEELQLLFAQIEALREYLGVKWVWDYDEIIGAEKKEEE